MWPNKTNEKEIVASTPKYFDDGFYYVCCYYICC